MHFSVAQLRLRHFFLFGVNGLKNNMLEEITRKVDKASTVSFDIFDTLVFRNIHKPTDIYRILEKIVFKKFGIKNFAELRIKAEITARKNAINGECTFEEIYMQLKNFCNCDVLEISQMELELEYDFITVNPFMKKIYDYAVSKGKQIILISDMYLSQEFICKLLDKCRYIGYKIFISNVFRVNKGSGLLYQVAQKECGIDKATWLHIGDNSLSDYKKAKEFGINAFNYKNVFLYEKVEPKTIGESIIAGIKNNILYNGNEVDYWTGFGIKYVASIYFGFTYWLYELTKNSDNMYFLARDGYAIKKIYDKICKLKNNDIFTEYVFCSRQSVQMPAMALSNDMSDTVKFLSIRNELTEYDLTLRELLNNVKIDENLISSEILRLFGFESFDDKITAEKHHSAQKIIGMFSEEVRKNLLEKYDICLRYLKQCSMQNFTKINVMDIGWSGSIQNSLHRILNQAVSGYYFGTIENNDFCNMFGWAFDESQPIENKDTVYNNVMMYELLFSAPHGSCVGYSEENGKIIPMLNNNVSFNKIVEIFQKSAIDTCDKFIKYYDYIDYIRPEFCIAPYSKFISKKNSSDIKCFSELSNDVAIGNSKMYPYVTTISSADIKKGSEFVIEKKQQGMWRGAWLFDNDVNDNDKALLYYFDKNDFTEEYIKFNLSHSKIYFDFGEGFSEENSVIVENEIDENKYSFVIDIPLNVKAIRIDPTEHHIIKMSNTSIKINGKTVKYNYSEYSKKLFSSEINFKNEDPFILINYDGKIERIEFYAKIKIIK